MTADGKGMDFDIVACATGFDVSYVPHFQIVGKDGVVMQDDWAETSNIYLSSTAPNYPNYFVINGPTGNWGQGCALPSHEGQIEYAMQCIQKLQDDRIKSLTSKQGLITQLNEYIDAWHRQKSVWAEECRSWYRDNKVHGRVYILPGRYDLSASHGLKLDV